MRWIEITETNTKKGCATQLYISSETTYSVQQKLKMNGHYPAYKFLGHMLPIN
jgi:hypothetical protein